MLKAVEHIGGVGIGVTSPQLFRADDGQVYVVKLQRNRLGTKILANELLAVKIGERLKLCFPASGVIELSQETINSYPRLAKAGVMPGRQFACRYLSHTMYVDRGKLAKAVNKEQLAGVMLFDHLLHNIDRTWNRKNLLIRHEQDGPKVYAIDNSHLFLRGRWTADSLKDLAGRMKVNSRRSYGVLLKYYLRPEHFASYAQAMLAISNEDVADIVFGIPEEWLPSHEERAALIEHIIIRRELVPDICRMLTALIPNINRSTNDNKRK